MTFVFNVIIYSVFGEENDKTYSAIIGVLAFFLSLLWPVIVAMSIVACLITALYWLWETSVMFMVKKVQKLKIIEKLRILLSI
jgi:hypothetical protein